jgi:putative transposase
MKKTILKGKRVRFYFNVEQRIQVAKTHGCVRLIHNTLLDLQKTRYENEPKAKFIGTFGMNDIVACYKNEKPFLREADSTALQSACSDLNTAYKNFFEGRADYPVFLAKHNEQSYTTKNINNSIQIVDDHHIRLPKLGYVYFKAGGMPKGRIKTVTVTKRPSGKYYGSILFETDVEEMPKTGRSVGIDMGLRDLMILSDGTKYESIRFDKRSDEKIRYWQRITDRRRKLAKAAIKEDEKLAKTDPDYEVRRLDDFRNYVKARQMAARYQERVRNQRNDYLQKITTELVRKNDVIVIEDLKTKGMMKNHRLARAVSNASWGSAARMLEYKCGWYGKTLKKVDPAYTSQTCHECGCRNDRLGLNRFGWLKVEQWVCPHCGAHLDRDVNAAQNILITAS